MIGVPPERQEEKNEEDECPLTLMDDFPPAPDRLVTLANWRKAPFCAWGFRNVRRLIPTANIAASGTARALELSLEEIGHVGFNGHDGEPTTRRARRCAPPIPTPSSCSGAGGSRWSGTATA